VSFQRARQGKPFHSKISDRRPEPRNLPS
jgi:hypothetical protein